MNFILIIKTQEVVPDRAKKSSKAIENERFLPPVGHLFFLNLKEPEVKIFEFSKLQKLIIKPN